MTRPKGTPQGPNFGTLDIVRISSTAYVVRTHFNPDEETMTSGNENANRYVAGEASVNLTINHDYATLRCEPDDASHLSVTHVVPMGKVIYAEGKTISLHSTTATKSISRKSLLEIASYLQESQEGLDAAYGNREFVRTATENRPQPFGSHPPTRTAPRSQWPKPTGT